MKVIKRDGSVVDYDYLKIQAAIEKCFAAIGDTDNYADVITYTLGIKIRELDVEELAVEEIQDMVEKHLMEYDEYDAAKAYILYRNEKAKLREATTVPAKIKAAFDRSSKYFKTPLQQFQFFDKYSRFDYNKGRRETWEETVARSVQFLREISDSKLKESEYQEIFDGILKMEVMPSMRLLAMAGEAAKRNNIALYNCSYSPIDSLDAFVEALTISMCGCGVGFSVESRYVGLLPIVSEIAHGSLPQTHVVEDSSDGWAQALKLALESYWAGKDIDFDYSLLRPAGAILKTKGGRSSGPAVLREMLGSIKHIIQKRAGKYIRPIDAHDIMCLVGDAAVQGGTRRTAMISLFDFDDKDMLHCKDGDFYVLHPYRWNANNSAVWPDRELSQLEVMNFFNSIAQSGTGEPGIFNRRAAQNTQPAHREVRDFGTNPCGEIILRPKGFCNLSSVVCRSDDELSDLKRKVRLATMIGTLQSMAVDFKGLRQEWTENAVDERLLGVDLNAHMDSAAARRPGAQEVLRDYAVLVNEQYAAKLGINAAASVTCVKPSGNSSTLLDTASGLHPRWAPYYMRNVRVSLHSPLMKVLKDAGVPMDPENGQFVDTATTWVAHFPVKSPDGAITKNDMTALDKCNYWLQVKQCWTTHNPSVTITYTDNEVIDIAQWIYEHQNVIGGMAFLPQSDAQYDQMPYEDLTQEQYLKYQSEFPNVDFSKIHLYELEDMTTASQELSCMSGQCEF